MPSDLSSLIAEEILSEVRKVRALDKRSAVYVDDINAGPVDGARTWCFQVARPSISPGAFSGGAYRQSIMVRMALFCSSGEDVTRESGSAQVRLGEKAVEIRQKLEGFYGTELNVPLFGMTGPSESHVWQHKDGTSGTFWVDWTMKAERWNTLVLFAAG